MTVYVDDVRHRYGRMVMAHMWADTEAELHEMAQAIGVARRWFQRPPKASWKHYDICLSKKAEAIRRGAVLTDMFGPLWHEALQKGDWKKLLQIYWLRQNRVEKARQIEPVRGTPMVRMPRRSKR